MSLFHKIALESEICDYLAANRWLYTKGEHAALLQERRTALISAAVTGQIDVQSH